MQIDQKYIEAIKKATTSQEIEDLRVKILGKNGIITNLLKDLAKENAEQKAIKGKELNILKNEVTQLIQEKKEELENKLPDDTFDYSIPLNQIDASAKSTNALPQIKLGTKHIIAQSIEKLHRIFKDCGFNFIEGPDIDDVYYNFEALNIAQDHPARDNNDTFYINAPNKLLRTHTTTTQTRLLESMKDNPNEIRAYSIGRVYRNDSHDATHASSFHQIEGIILEDGITMQHLKGFLEHVLEEFFEQKATLRFRPSYFPFTEPSCEVDVFIKHSSDNKLEITTQEEGRPLELGGCGIIHPSILENFNQKGKQAFAFGMGLERWIMVKHGIKTLHDLYDNHLPTLRYIAQE